MFSRPEIEWETLLDNSRSDLSNQKRRNPRPKVHNRPKSDLLPTSFSKYYPTTLVDTVEHFVSDFRKYAILINSPSQNHESEHFSLRIFGFEGFTFVKVVLRNWIIQVS